MPIAIVFPSTWSSCVPQCFSFPSRTKRYRSYYSRALSIVSQCVAPCSRRHERRQELASTPQQFLYLTSPPHPCVFRQENVSMGSHAVTTAVLPSAPLVCMLGSVLRCVPTQECRAVFFAAIFSSIGKRSRVEGGGGWSRGQHQNRKSFRGASTYRRHGRSFSAGMGWRNRRTHM